MNQQQLNALVALLADLYAQVAALQQENAELKRGREDGQEQTEDQRFTSTLP
jgi:hypothetical protein